MGSGIIFVTKTMSGAISTTPQGGDRLHQLVYASNACVFEVLEIYRQWAHSILDRSPKQIWLWLSFEYYIAAESLQSRPWSSDVNVFPSKNDACYDRGRTF